MKIFISVALFSKKNPITQCFNTINKKKNLLKKIQALESVF